jgi:hypothetical protein
MVILDVDIKDGIKKKTKANMLMNSALLTIQIRVFKPIAIGGNEIFGF